MTYSQSEKRMPERRRTFLKKGSAVAVGLSGLLGRSSAASQSLPIQQIRHLLWNGKHEQAQRVLERNNANYTMGFGYPSDAGDGVSTERFGSPSEDANTYISLTLVEVDSGSPPVYEATLHFQLSEWDDDLNDYNKQTDPWDGASISYSQNYWQAVDQNRDNVYYDDSRFSYGEYLGYGVRMEYDDPETPNDGTDQTIYSGFSTRIEAINRNLYTGEYNVGANYTHTWTEGQFDLSWNFEAFSLDAYGDGIHDWSMNESRKA